LIDSRLLTVTRVVGRVWRYWFTFVGWFTLDSRYVTFVVTLRLITRLRWFVVCWVDCSRFYVYFTLRCYVVTVYVTFPVWFTLRWVVARCWFVVVTFDSVCYVVVVVVTLLCDLVCWLWFVTLRFCWLHLFEFVVTFDFVDLLFCLHICYVVDLILLIVDLRRLICVDLLWLFTLLHVYVVTLICDFTTTFVTHSYVYVADYVGYVWLFTDLRWFPFTHVYAWLFGYHVWLRYHGLRNLLRSHTFTRLLRLLRCVVALFGLIHVTRYVWFHTRCYGSFTVTDGYTRSPLVVDYVPTFVGGWLRLVPFVYVTVVDLGVYTLRYRLFTTLVDCSVTFTRLRVRLRWFTGCVYRSHVCCVTGCCLRRYHVTFYDHVYPVCCCSVYVCCCWLRYVWFPALLRCYVYVCGWFVTGYRFGLRVYVTVTFPLLLVCCYGYGCYGSRLRYVAFVAVYVYVTFTLRWIRLRFTLPFDLVTFTFTFTRLPFTFYVARLPVVTLRLRLILRCYVTLLVTFGSHVVVVDLLVTFGVTFDLRYPLPRVWFRLPVDYVYVWTLLLLLLFTLLRSPLLLPFTFTNAHLPHVYGVVTFWFVCYVTIYVCSRLLICSLPLLTFPLDVYVVPRCYVTRYVTLLRCCWFPLLLPTFDLRCCYVWLRYVTFGCTFVVARWVTFTVVTFPRLICPTFVDCCYVTFVVVVTFVVTLYVCCWFVDYPICWFVGCYVYIYVTLIYVGRVCWFGCCYVVVAFPVDLRCRLICYGCWLRCLRLRWLVVVVVGYGYILRWVVRCGLYILLVVRLRFVTLIFVDRRCWFDLRLICWLLPHTTRYVVVVIYRVYVVTTDVYVPRLLVTRLGGYPFHVYVTVTFTRSRLRLFTFVVDLLFPVDYVYVYILLLIYGCGWFVTLRWFCYVVGCYIPVWLRFVVDLRCSLIYHVVVVTLIYTRLFTLRWLLLQTTLFPFTFTHVLPVPTLIYTLRFTFTLRLFVTLLLLDVWFTLLRLRFTRFGYVAGLRVLVTHVLICVVVGVTLLVILRFVVVGCCCVTFPVTIYVDFVPVVTGRRLFYVCWLLRYVCLIYDLPLGYGCWFVPGYSVGYAIWLRLVRLCRLLPTRLLRLRLRWFTFRLIYVCSRLIYVTLFVGWFTLHYVVVVTFTFTHVTFDYVPTTFTFVTLLRYRLLRVAVDLIDGYVGWLIYVTTVYVPFTLLRLHTPFYGWFGYGYGSGCGYGYVSVPGWLVVWLHTRFCTHGYVWLIYGYVGCYTFTFTVAGLPVATRLRFGYGWLVYVGLVPFAVHAFTFGCGYVCTRFPVYVYVAHTTTHTHVRLRSRYVVGYVDCVWFGCSRSHVLIWWFIPVRLVTRCGCSLIYGYVYVYVVTVGLLPVTFGCCWLVGLLRLHHGYDLRLLILHLRLRCWFPTFTFTFTFDLRLFGSFTSHTHFTFTRSGYGCLPRLLRCRAFGYTRLRFTTVTLPRFVVPRLRLRSRFTLVTFTLVILRCWVTHVHCGCTPFTTTRSTFPARLPLIPGRSPTRLRYVTHTRWLLRFVTLRWLRYVYVTFTRFGFVTHVPVYTFTVVGAFYVWLSFTRTTRLVGCCCYVWLVYTRWLRLHTRCLFTFPGYVTTLRRCCVRTFATLPVGYTHTHTTRLHGLVTAVCYTLRGFTHTVYVTVTVGLIWLHVYGWLPPHVCYATRLVGWLRLRLRLHVYVWLLRTVTPFDLLYVTRLRLIYVWLRLHTVWFDVTTHICGSHVVTVTRLHGYTLHTYYTGRYGYVTFYGYAHTHTVPTRSRIWLFALFTRLRLPVTLLRTVTLIRSHDLVTDVHCGLHTLRCGLVDSRYVCFAVCVCVCLVVRFVTFTTLRLRLRGYVCYTRTFTLIWLYRGCWFRLDVGCYGYVCYCSRLRLHVTFPLRLRYVGYVCCRLRLFTLLGRCYVYVTLPTFTVVARCYGSRYVYRYVRLIYVYGYDFTFDLRSRCYPVVVTLLYRLHVVYGCCSCYIYRWLTTAHVPVDLRYVTLFVYVYVAFVVTRYRLVTRVVDSVYDLLRVPWFGYVDLRCGYVYGYVWLRLRYGALLFPTFTFTFARLVTFTFTVRYVVTFGWLRLRLLICWFTLFVDCSLICWFRTLLLVAVVVLRCTTDTTILLLDVHTLHRCPFVVLTLLFVVVDFDSFVVGYLNCWSRYPHGWLVTILLRSLLVHHDSLRLRFYTRLFPIARLHTFYVYVDYVTFRLLIPVPTFTLRYVCYRLLRFTLRLIWCYVVGLLDVYVCWFTLLVVVRLLFLRCSLRLLLHLCWICYVTIWFTPRTRLRFWFVVVVPRCCCCCCWCVCYHVYVTRCCYVAFVVDLLNLRCCCCCLIWFDSVVVDLPLFRSRSHVVTTFTHVTLLRLPVCCYTFPFAVTLHHVTFTARLHYVPLDYVRLRSHTFGPVYVTLRYTTRCHTFDRSTTRLLIYTTVPHVYGYGYVYVTVAVTFTFVIRLITVTHVGYVWLRLHGYVYGTFTRLHVYVYVYVVTVTFTFVGLRLRLLRVYARYVTFTFTVYVLGLDYGYVCWFPFTLIYGCWFPIYVRYCPILGFVDLLERYVTLIPVPTLFGRYVTHTFVVGCYTRLIWVDVVPVYVDLICWLLVIWLHFTFPLICCVVDLITFTFDLLGIYVVTFPFGCLFSYRLRWFGRWLRCYDTLRSHVYVGCWLRWTFTTFTRLRLHVYGSRYVVRSGWFVPVYVTITFVGRCWWFVGYVDLLLLRCWFHVIPTFTTLLLLLRLRWFVVWFTPRYVTLVIYVTFTLICYTLPFTLRLPVTFYVYVTRVYPVLPRLLVVTHHGLLVPTHRFGYGYLRSPRCSLPVPTRLRLRLRLRCWFGCWYALHGYAFTDLLRLRLRLPFVTFTHTFTFGYVRSTLHTVTRLPGYGWLHHTHRLPVTVVGWFTFVVVGSHFGWLPVTFTHVVTLVGWIHALYVACGLVTFVTHVYHTFTHVCVTVGYYTRYGLDFTDSHVGRGYVPVYVVRCCLHRTAFTFVGLHHTFTVWLFTLLIYRCYGWLHVPGYLRCCCVGCYVYVYRLHTLILHVRLFTLRVHVYRTHVYRLVTFCVGLLLHTRLIWTVGCYGYVDLHVTFTRSHYVYGLHGYLRLRFTRLPHGYVWLHVGLHGCWLPHTPRYRLRLLRLLIPGSLDFTVCYVTFGYGYVTVHGFTTGWLPHVWFTVTVGLVYVWLVTHCRFTRLPHVYRLRFYSFTPRSTHRIWFTRLRLPLIWLRFTHYVWITFTLLGLRSYVGYVWIYGYVPVTLRLHVYLRYVRCVCWFTTVARLVGCYGYPRLVAHRLRARCWLHFTLFYVYILRYVYVCTLRLRLLRLFVTLLVVTVYTFTHGWLRLRLPFTTRFYVWRLILRLVVTLPPRLRSDFTFTFTPIYTRCVDLRLLRSTLGWFTRFVPRLRLHFTILHVYTRVHTRCVLRYGYARLLLHVTHVYVTFYVMRFGFYICVGCTRLRSGYGYVPRCTAVTLLWFHGRSAFTVYDSPDLPTLRLVTHTVATFTFPYTVATFVRLLRLRLLPTHTVVTTFTVIPVPFTHTVWLLRWFWRWFDYRLRLFPVTTVPTVTFTRCVTFDLVWIIYGWLFPALITFGLRYRLRLRSPVTVCCSRLDITLRLFPFVYVLRWLHVTFTVTFTFVWLPRLHVAILPLHLICWFVGDYVDLLLLICCSTLFPLLLLRSRLYALIYVCYIYVTVGPLLRYVVVTFDVYVVGYVTHTLFERYRWLRLLVPHVVTFPVVTFTTTRLRLRLRSRLPFTVTRLICSYGRLRYVTVWFCYVYHVASYTRLFDLRLLVTLLIYCVVPTLRYGWFWFTFPVTLITPIYGYVVPVVGCWLLVPVDLLVVPVLPRSRLVVCYVCWFPGCYVVTFVRLRSVPVVTLIWLLRLLHTHGYVVTFTLILHVRLFTLHRFTFTRLRLRLQFTTRVPVIYNGYTHLHYTLRYRLPTFPFPGLRYGFGFGYTFVPTTVCSLRVYALRSVAVVPRVYGYVVATFVHVTFTLLLIWLVDFVWTTFPTVVRLRLLSVAIYVCYVIYVVVAFTFVTLFVVDVVVVTDLLRLLICCCSGDSVPRFTFHTLNVDLLVNLRFGVVVGGGVVDYPVVDGDVTLLLLLRCWFDLRCYRTIRYVDFVVVVDWCWLLLLRYIYVVVTIDSDLHDLRCLLWFVTCRYVTDAPLLLTLLRLFPRLLPHVDTRPFTLITLLLLLRCYVVELHCYVDCCCWWLLPIYDCLVWFVDLRCSHLFVVVDSVVGGYSPHIAIYVVPIPVDTFALLLIWFTRCWLRLNVDSTFPVVVVVDLFPLLLFVPLLIVVTLLLLIVTFVWTFHVEFAPLRCCWLLRLRSLSVDVYVRCSDLIRCCCDVPHVTTLLLFPLLLICVVAFLVCYDPTFVCCCWFYDLRSRSVTVVFTLLVVVDVWLLLIPRLLIYLLIVVDYGFVVTVVVVTVDCYGWFWLRLRLVFPVTFTLIRCCCYVYVYVVRYVDWFTFGCVCVFTLVYLHTFTFTLITFRWLRYVVAFDLPRFTFTFPTFTLVTFTVYVDLVGSGWFTRYVPTVTHITFGLRLLRTLRFPTFPVDFPTVVTLTFTVLDVTHVCRLVTRLLLLRLRTLLILRLRYVTLVTTLPLLRCDLRFTFTFVVTVDLRLLIVTFDLRLRCWFYVPVVTRCWTLLPVVGRLRCGRYVVVCPHVTFVTLRYVVVVPDVGGWFCCLLLLRLPFVYTFTVYAFVWLPFTVYDFVTRWFVTLVVTLLRSDVTIRLLRLHTFYGCCTRWFTICYDVDLHARSVRLFDLLRYGCWFCWLLLYLRCSCCADLICCTVTFPIYGWVTDTFSIYPRLRLLFTVTLICSHLHVTVVALRCWFVWLRLRLIVVVVGWFTRLVIYTFSSRFCSLFGDYGCCCYGYIWLLLLVLIVICCCCCCCCCCWWLRWCWFTRCGWFVVVVVVVRLPTLPDVVVTLLVTLFHVVRFTVCWLFVTFTLFVVTLLGVDFDLRCDSVYDFTVTIYVVDLRLITLIWFGCCWLVGYVTFTVTILRLLFPDHVTLRYVTLVPLRLRLVGYVYWLVVTYVPGCYVAHVVVGCTFTVCWCWRLRYGRFTTFGWLLICYVALRFTRSGWFTVSLHTFVVVTLVLGYVRSLRLLRLLLICCYVGWFVTGTLVPLLRLLLFDLTLLIYVTFDLVHVGRLRFTLDFDWLLRWLLFVAPLRLVTTFGYALLFPTFPAFTFTFAVPVGYVTVTHVYTRLRFVWFAILRLPFPLRCRLLPRYPHLRLHVTFPFTVIYVRLIYVVDFLLLLIVTLVDLRLITVWCCWFPVVTLHVDWLIWLRCLRLRYVTRTHHTPHDYTTRLRLFYIYHVGTLLVCCYVDLLYIAPLDDCWLHLRLICWLTLCVYVIYVVRCYRIYVPGRWWILPRWFPLVDLLVRSPFPVYVTDVVLTNSPHVAGYVDGPDLRWFGRYVVGRALLIYVCCSGCWRYDLRWLLRWLLVVIPRWFRLRYPVYLPPIDLPLLRSLIYVVPVVTVVTLLIYVGYSHVYHVWSRIVTFVVTRWFVTLVFYVGYYYVGCWFGGCYVVVTLLLRLIPICWFTRLRLRLICYYVDVVRRLRWLFIYVGWRFTLIYYTFVRCYIYTHVYVTLLIRCYVVVITPRYRLLHVPLYGYDFTVTISLPPHVYVTLIWFGFIYVVTHVTFAICLPVTLLLLHVYVCCSLLILRWAVDLTFTRYVTLRYVVTVVTFVDYPTFVYATRFTIYTRLRVTLLRSVTGWFTRLRLDNFGLIRSLRLRCSLHYTRFTRSRLVTTVVTLIYVCYVPGWTLRYGRYVYVRYALLRLIYIYLTLRLDVGARSGGRLHCYVYVCSRVVTVVTLRLQFTFTGYYDVVDCCWCLLHSTVRCWFVRWWAPLLVLVLLLTLLLLLLVLLLRCCCWWCCCWCCWLRFTLLRWSRWCWLLRCCCCVGDLFTLICWFDLRYDLLFERCWICCYTTDTRSLLVDVTVDSLRCLICCCYDLRYVGYVCWFVIPERCLRWLVTRFWRWRCC